MATANVSNKSNANKLQGGGAANQQTDQNQGLHPQLVPCLDAAAKARIATSAA